jgi:hypothetical protein
MHRRRARTYGEEAFYEEVPARAPKAASLEEATLAAHWAAAAPAPRTRVDAFGTAALVALFVIDLAAAFGRQSDLREATRFGIDLLAKAMGGPALAR